MDKLDLSVHQLVDFILRSGDIDNRVFNRSSMSEGTLLHALYQSKQSDNYLSEYFLETDLVVEEFNVHIEGRADGIIKRNSKKYVIDEIKTTVIDLEEFFLENEAWHLGQARLYGYMFLKEKGLDNIEVRLTYISQKNHSKKLIKSYFYSFEELQQFVVSLIEEYLDFHRVLKRKQFERDASLKELAFPFSNYREGQKELSKYVYGISIKGGKLFVEAPTGIGKTMSTLFPAVKSLVEDPEGKVFYLTAKASGKENAYNALNILSEKGANISYISVTSKEKICLCKGKGCNPDECPYTKGYYSKISTILKYALVTYHNFDYDRIIKLAKEYQVCPFELELDLSLYLDAIICDYNYVFDPISYIHRYFDEDASHHIVLVDEAHNLVERSRDMYSASIKEEDFILAKKGMRKSNYRPLKTIISKLNKYFINLKEIYEVGNNDIPNLNEETTKLFARFIELMLDASKNHSNEVSKELLDFYLSVNRFMKIYEIANDSYLYNIAKSEKDINIELICLDASLYLKDITARIKSAIYFSATLSPIDYYINTLGGDKETNSVIKLDSPFPKENFLLLVAPKVSIKYKNRESSYSTVAEYIQSFINAKKGNYLIFLPSYEYLDHLLPLFENSKAKLLIQKREMNELDKQDYINSFVEHPKKTTVGFAILGGSFAEGIDLVATRLIGAVVVGIGLPKINYVSDSVMKYFDAQDINGRNYAYIYPGINKVMQAVGRVIRDEDDKGAVLLIDERYTTYQYRELFKKEWSNYELVYNKEEVIEELAKFYKEDEQ